MKKIDFSVFLIKIFVAVFLQLKEFIEKMNKALQERKKTINNSNLLSLFILSLFVGNPELSKALGADIPSFHLGLITFGFLYSPISTIVGIIMNMVSRKNEYAADEYASIEYKGIHLQNALKTLSVNNLSNLTPHPLYVFFNYSHPTLLQRLKFIDQFNK